VSALQVYNLSREITQRLKLTKSWLAFKIVFSILSGIDSETADQVQNQKQ
jgi:hypothetical protein